MIIFCFIVCLSQVLSTNVIEASETLQSDDIILTRLSSIISSLKNSTTKCKSDLNFTLNSINEMQTWAVEMFDASVKSPVGLDYGDEYQFGNFDECLNTKTSHTFRIQPKYCLVNVDLNEFDDKKTEKLDKSKMIYWGICVPNSCTNDDIISLMKAVTGYKKVTIDSNLCQSKSSEFNLTSNEIVFGIFFLTLASIIMLSTCLHARVMSRKKGGKLRNDVFVEGVIQSFSLISNVKKLGQASRDEAGLSCINGVKAISMFCILCGHSLLFMVGGPVKNTNFFREQSQNVRNAFLFNSPLLVDSFLMLSGFLFTRLILEELEKRQGRINFGILYIFRYIRLTPAYFAMISFYATWFIRLGDGPLWMSNISREQERCEISWWRNILYINNYIGTDDICMFQSWYLAADTQLFILAPLLIYPLWKSRKMGIILTLISGIASMIIPFYVTYSQNLDPTFIIRPSEVSDLSSNDYFVNTYGKTHMRATAYILGIFLGFLAFHIHKKRILIEKNIRRIMWLLTGSLGIYSMCSVTLYYLPSYEYSNLEAALYNSLHRLGWNILVGWLLLACITSEKGAIKKFLSSRALVPFSRLTYCAYLTNGFIELYLSSSIRSPKYMSVISMLSETLSHVLLTFMAAVILCLMFESPIHGLEKMLLNRFINNKKERVVNHNSSDSDTFNVNSHSSSLSETSTSTS